MIFPGQKQRGNIFKHMLGQDFLQILLKKVELWISSLVSQVKTNFSHQYFGVENDYFSRLYLKNSFAYFFLAKIISYAHSSSKMRTTYLKIVWTFLQLLQISAGSCTRQLQTESPANFWPFSHNSLFKSFKSAFVKQYQEEIHFQLQFTFIL